MAATGRRATVAAHAAGKAAAGATRKAAAKVAAKAGARTKTAPPPLTTPRTRGVGKTAAALKAVTSPTPALATRTPTRGASKTGETAATQTTSKKTVGATATTALDAKAGAKAATKARTSTNAPGRQTQPAATDRHAHAIATLTAADPALGQLLAKHPPPASFREVQIARDGRAMDHFQKLCRTIIYQQLAGAAAQTIYRRFVALFPAPPTWTHDPALYFPTPAQLLGTSIDELRSAGLSGQKASYLQDLARKADDGTLQFHLFDTLDDQQITAQLLSVKGIGQWTVDMHLLFHMDRPNVLPVGDLGVRKGIMRHFGLRALPDKHDMVRLTAHWEPYRSLGSWLMWRVADS